jgi:hypothetical protein
MRIWASTRTPIPGVRVGVSIPVTVRNTKLPPWLHALLFLTVALFMTGVALNSDTIMTVGLWAMGIAAIGGGLTAALIETLTQQRHNHTRR